MGEFGESGEPLTSELVKSNLSNLGKGADGSRFAYLDLVLREQRISNVDVLQSFVHVQVLDLSWNLITDLCVLGNLLNLCKLNVSHNRLVECLNFMPPRNLQNVDCSFNQISNFEGIARHRFLRVLRINDNNIRRMGDGLETLRCLKVLCMANNHVRNISAVDDLPIRMLDLTNNELDFVENVETLHSMQELLLSKNRLSSLAPLSSCNSLQRIEAAHNLIVDLEQMLFLAELPLLTHLNLKGNAVQETSMFRLRVIQRLPSLLSLDATEVVPEEKVAAWNFHNPPARQSGAASFMPQTGYAMPDDLNHGGTVYAN